MNKILSGRGTRATPFRSVHMHLRAHDCRERAMEARGLAGQAKRPAAKNSFQQAAQYWLALAERVEIGERKSIFLAQPIVHSNRMPLVGYLLSVGGALFLGLLSLSAYLGGGSDSAAKLSAAKSTAPLVPVQPASQRAH
jgi:hypothetical protein